MGSYRMFRRGDTLYLMLPEEMVESTIKRLQMFILMSKVTIADAGCSLLRFGVSGADAETELKDILGKAPAEPDQVMVIDEVSVIRVRGEQPRFVLLGDVEDLKQIWEKLNVRGAPVGASSWRLLDIMAGIPNIYQATREAFVPQMLNLELLKGVSFQKGCYTGQEIVARMHYLGKLKRRMYRLHFEGDALPAPGTPLFSPDDDTQQAIGTIVDSALAPSGGVESLAVVTIQYADPEKPLMLESVDGRVAKLHFPPYELKAKTA